MTDSASRTIHTVLLGLLGVSIPALARAQDKPGSAVQNPAVKKVIDALKAREKSLTGLTLKMTTTGSYPGGHVFHTSGSIRVLGTTHFHIQVESSFGQDRRVRSSEEWVITPDGVLTHQKGPLEEVYTRMEPELMNRLKEAERALAADKGPGMRNPGPFAGNGDAPLGSAMLEALDLQFELNVGAEQVSVAGVPCKVIGGRWRGAAAIPEPDTSGQAVQRVEVFLRAADGIPIRVVHYNHGGLEGGKPKEAIAFEMNVSDLDLAPELDPKGFTLALPAGVKPIPVMDHRPSRAQIDRILQEYEAVKKGDGPDGPQKVPGKGDKGK